MTDLERFFERLAILNLKLAPKKAYIGVRVIKFLGHRVTAKGVSLTRKKWNLWQNYPCRQISVSYDHCWVLCRTTGNFLPQMSTVTRPLNKLLKKGVKFVFTTEHVEIVQNLIKRLTSPDVLAFPDFKAALSGDRPFRLITDASVDGLGAVMNRRNQIHLPDLYVF